MFNVYTVRSHDLAVAMLVNSAAQKIKSAISRRGNATIAVPGGQTPASFLPQLFSQPLDWSKTKVTLTDERWVPGNSIASNGRSTLNLLENTRARAAKYCGWQVTSVLPTKGKTQLESALRPLFPRFNVVFLGMGDDGHIASLFPGRDVIHCNDDLFVAIDEKLVGYPRMSLSRKAITTADHVFLVYKGQRKRQVFQKSLLPGSVSELPVRLLRSCKGSVQVFELPTD